MRPPESNKIISIINKLKNGKACTDIPAEFLKPIIDCFNYVAMLVDLCEEVWEKVQHSPILLQTNPLTWLHS